MAQRMQSNGAHEPEADRIIAAQAETIAQQDATIRDLRARLDREAEERRALSERLTALLTHRQAGSVPSVPVLRLPWWGGFCDRFRPADQSGTGAAGTGECKGSSQENRPGPVRRASRLGSTDAKNSSRNGRRLAV
jgi:hypothetical protein